MIVIAKIRSALFAGGIAAVLLSALLIGVTFLRHVRPGEAALPWIRWGMGSVAAGFLLCLFGKRWWRIAGLTAAFVFVICWLLMAESLYQ